MPLLPMYYLNNMTHSLTVFIPLVNGEDGTQALTLQPLRKTVWVIGRKNANLSLVTAL